MKYLINMLLAFVLLGCEYDQVEYSDEYPISVLPELETGFKEFMQSEKIRYRKEGKFFIIENQYTSTALEKFIKSSGAQQAYINRNPDTELRYCCYISGHKRGYLELLKGDDFWALLDEDIESTLREYTDYVFDDNGIITDVELFDDLKLKVYVRPDIDEFTIAQIKREFFDEGGIHYLGLFELPDRPSGENSRSFFMNKYLMDSVVRDYLKDLDVEIIIHTD